MENNSKKALIFSIVYLPRFVGGAEIAVKEITDRISDISFTMVTLRTERQKIERVGNIAVYRIGPYVGGNSINQKILRMLMKYLFPVAAFLKAKKLHQQNKYQYIWPIMANYAGFAALFFKIRFPQIPFLLTLQEGDPIPYIKRRVMVVYPLFKMIFKKADKIQAISSYLARFAKSMGFIGEPSVVPNGVDIHHFTQVFTPESLLSIREKFGFTKNDIVLVTVSRLVKKNGVGDIIAALALLPEKYKLLVLGTGVLEKRLRDQAKRLRIEKRVTFAGYVSHDELPRYLKASDIFVRPSLSEGLGNSFLEAMAAGLPVIATPVGGIPDFLRDGDTGLFCEARNPESIAKSVLDLQDVSLRQKIAEAGLKMVREKYDWEMISKEVEKLLNK